MQAAGSSCHSATVPVLKYFIKNALLQKGMEAGGICFLNSHFVKICLDETTNCTQQTLNSRHFEVQAFQFFPISAFNITPTLSSTLAV